MLQTFGDASSGSQPDLNQVLPLASLEGSSTKTYSLAVVGLDAYRCDVLGMCGEQWGWEVCRGWREASVQQGGVWDELLSLVPAWAVNHKVCAQEDLSFTILWIYFADGFRADLRIS